MRKHFLIKPKLQLTHLAWVLGVILVAAIMGYVLFEMVLAKVVAPEIQVSAGWMELRNSLRLGFGLLLFILISAIGIENYLFFHRIIGPIYALEKGLKRLAQGDFSESIHVRESDELKELVQVFESVKESLQSRLQTQDEMLRRISEELDLVLKNTTPENIESLQQKLKSIREEVEKKAA